MRCTGCGTTHNASFCPNCGKPAQVQCTYCGKVHCEKFCPNCANAFDAPRPANKVPYTAPQQNNSALRCPRCGANNVTVHPVTKIWSKYRGCFGWFLWILLAICTVGLILIIPLLTNSKTKSKTHYEAVCQNCGKHWRV